MPKLVQIAVPAPTENLFTYRVDDEQNGADLTGRRALVPFGKRVLTGIIVSDEAVERKNVRNVIEILDPEPVDRKSVV